MGLFSKNSKPAAKAKEAKKVVAKKDDAPKAPKTEKTSSFVANKVISNPRITEKAAHISDNRVYTFDVYPKATKIDIVKAIKEIYNVTPIRVNVLAIPTKRVFRAKHIGVKRGGRKAYVYLKKGDKIEFI